MELTPKQQTVELIRQADTILLATHKNPDGDGVGALVALSLALKSIGKTVTLIAPGEVSPALKFLPEQSSIQPILEGSKDLVIVLDTAGAQGDEIKLGYKNDRQKNQLSIVVSAPKTAITKDKVSFSQNLPKFDLIVALDVADIERLGTLYDEFTPLFYETPLINIDHHPSNDHFGKVNWIDITAASTCEILVSLIESLSAHYPDRQLMTEDVATALLTGIITDTDSFQNNNTTPKSFTVAAQLAGAGARQQDIVRSIYKTKSLSTLRLWGKVLTRVSEESEPSFVWSYVASSDFDDTQSSPAELTGLIDELLKGTPGTLFALLFSERPKAKGELVLHASLRAVSPTTDVSAIAAGFGGGGHAQAAAFEQERQGELLEQISTAKSKIKSDWQKLRAPLQMPKD